MRVGGNRRPARCALLVAAVLALIPIDAARAAGAVVNVPSEVTTIQAAIDAVASGGTVVVAPGVYRENLDFHGREVEVRSSGGPTTTVIDGGGTGTTVLFDQFETRATVLRGFTIRNGRESGIRITNASPTIAGNIVTANSATYGGGFYIAGGSPLVQDNVVSKNADRGGFGGGFYLITSGGTEIVGNTIENNTGSYFGGGIDMWTAEDVLVLNNVFRGNRAVEGGAIHIVNYSWPLVSQNVFVANEASYMGGALTVRVPVGFEGAQLANNTLVGNRAPHGSAIASSGDYLAVNNIISGPPEAEVVLCDGGAGRLFFNDVHNGTASPFRWCPETIGIVGNVSVDPRLATDFSLPAGSPLLDAGHDDPLRPLLRPTDAHGAPRVLDGDGDGVPVVDMGALEWPGVVSPPPGPAPASFHPLTPARILDTRDGTGGVSGPAGPGATLVSTVTGRGGVPATGVSAVVPNVTATQPSTGGYLTVFPTGVARPLSSSLNFAAGQTVPNLVMAKVGTGGRVDVYNHSGSTHVVVDVVGWFGGNGGSRFNALTPARILDTRDATVGSGAPLDAGVTAPVTVIGRGGVPASGVTAVLLNVTATQPTAGGYLTVFPGNSVRPLASSLNFVPGQTVPNLVVAKADSDGVVNVYNRSGTTHVIFDVVGWFGPEGSAGGALFRPLTPARILDSRNGTGGESEPVGPGATAFVTVTGRGGVPAGRVSAVVLNVTATQPSGGGYLTVFPAGAERPLASSLNFVSGQTVANLVVAKVGADGKVGIYNRSGTTHVVFDVVGWYAT